SRVAASVACDPRAKLTHDGRVAPPWPVGINAAHPRSARRPGSAGARTTARLSLHAREAGVSCAEPRGASAMAQPSLEPTVVKAYWQPGCTSCLRMKEFLTRHGVPFVSVNVLEDTDGFAELASLGIRTVPIVRRGADWANGQVLRDVARVAGIPWGGASMLPVPEMCDRLVEIQTTAQRLFAQIPDAALGTQLPNRPRSYAQLAYHIFNIADA